MHGKQDEPECHKLFIEPLLLCDTTKDVLYPVYSGR